MTNNNLDFQELIDDPALFTYILVNYYLFDLFSTISPYYNTTTILILLELDHDRIF